MKRLIVNGCKNIGRIGLRFFIIGSGIRILDQVEITKKVMCQEISFKSEDIFDKATKISFEVF